MGTYFVSGLGSKLGVKKGFIGVTLVGLEVGKTLVLELDQKYLMCDGKN